MLRIFFVAFWLGFQAQPQARGSIEGTVVRAGAAAAGAPEQLPNARVELKPGNIAVFTNEAGAFRFLSVASGQYTISVTRDGYVPLEDPKHGQTVAGLTVTLAPSATLKNLVIPMTQSPVLSGRVFDPHGEPLATALVRAYQRQYTPYGTRLKIVRKGMTDDFGEFRLFGLNFGEYFVSAGYSDRDQTSAIGKAQLSANVSKPDDGYATVFYDGVEELSAARMARVAPGADAGSLALYFRAAARLNIRGQVVPAIPGTRIAFVPRGSDLADADAFIQTNAAGMFQISAVSPGTYLLLATAANGELSSDVVVVNVTDSDIDGMRLSLAETKSVSGTLSIEGNPGADLSRLHVKLLRSNPEFDQSFDAPVTPDGAFAFDHVPLSAEYDVIVGPLPAATYVKRITSGNKNILQGQSRLLPDQRLQIVLATASADDNVEVHVTHRGKPAISATVVFLPETSLRRRADRYVTAFTDETGTAQMRGVPTGYYTAYAFEHIERDWQYALAYSASGQDRFRDRSFSVLADKKGTKVVELRLIPLEETAGGVQ
jgi:hypothetical protein